MPLILPGNVASATASTTYSVDNSCMFNGADTYLSRTTSATAPTLSTKATLSFWIKMCEVVASSQDYVTYTNGANVPYFNLQLPSGGGDLALYEDNTGTSQDTAFVTTRVFRDPAAWYHVCYSFDSTPSTPSSSSIKLFINGVQQTAFSSETYPAQNTATNLTAASTTHPIGVHANTTAQFLNAYLAEYMLVDGQALDADSFGEFDSDSPTIWKPIDISGITVGNQGYYLDFKDSSNLGNDVGGNDFDFTSNNIDATNQATDTPTNNFCVMNPLDNYIPGSTFAEGNCLLTTPSSGNNWNTGTFGLTTGKWYYEVFIQTDPYNNNSEMGIVGRPQFDTTHHMGRYSDTWSYSGQGYWYNDNSGTSTGFVSATANDIVGCYIDLDNNKIYWAKNGTIQNSGTGITIDAASATTSGFYFPAVGDYHSSVGAFRVNFGNPIWSLSSAVADANGYGNFEYDPSDGGNASFDGSAKDFLAICTKNLGSDGG